MIFDKTKFQGKITPTLAHFIQIMINCVLGNEGGQEPLAPDLFCSYSVPPAA